MTDLIHTKQIALWSVGAMCVVLLSLYVFPFIRPIFMSTAVHEAPLVSTVYLSEKMEVIKESSLPAPILTGVFVGFGSLDNATGTVRIIETPIGFVMRFEEDFKVVDELDAYIGFGKDGKYIEGSEMAPLKRNIGAQNYQADKAFDTERFNEVWIWSKRFSKPVAKAILTTM